MYLIICRKIQKINCKSLIDKSKFCGLLNLLIKNIDLSHLFPLIFVLKHFLIPCKFMHKNLSDFTPKSSITNQTTAVSILIHQLWIVFLEEVQDRRCP